ncbi:MobA/MobL family protein, partial [Xanthomonas citri pv. citri]
KDNTGKTPQQRELEIKEQRLRWQEMANRHLLEAGLKPSIDVRNWKDKGLDEKPKNKSMWQWQSEKRAEKLLQAFQIEVLPTYQNEARPPKNEPYEARNAYYYESSPDF